MATFVRIRKLANPQRRRKPAASGVRRAVKPAKRKAARKTISRRKVARKAVKRRNPALLVTLGAVNPQKRKVKVARKKKRNPVTRSRRSRNAATRIVVVAPKRRRSVRKSNPTRRRTSIRRAKRNPSVFGSRLGSGQTLSMIAGGLLGVTAAKIIPGMLPASLTSTPILRLFVTGGSAYLASLLASKVFSGPFSDAVFFGGLMQTGSVGLNVFVPSLGRQIGLSGMGELVPGQFAVPQNPLMIPAPPVQPTARVNLNGLTRAFASGFGR